MGADLQDKHVIMKIIILTLAILCYVLLFFFFHKLRTIELLFIATMLAGFMWIYIMLVVGLCCNNTVDEEYVIIWSLYAACAYTATGIMILCSSENWYNRNSKFLSNIMNITSSIIPDAIETVNFDDLRVRGSHNNRVIDDDDASKAMGMVCGIVSIIAAFIIALDGSLTGLGQ